MIAQSSKGQCRLPAREAKGRESGLLALSEHEGPMRGD
jgi:hypothetical protein